METINRLSATEERTASARIRSLPMAAGVAALGLVIGMTLGVAVAAASPPVVIGALVGLAVMAAIVAEPRIGIVAFIAVACLLPFAVIPVSLGPVKPTLVDLTLLPVLIVWVIRALADPNRRLYGSGVDVQVLLFVASCIVSFILGTAYHTTTSDVRLFGELLSAVIFFFSVVQCVRDLRTVRRLLLALVLGGVLAALIAIVLYYLPAGTSTAVLASLSRFGYPSSNILQYNPGTTIQRAIGTSIDPNILGATLMTCGVLVVGLLGIPRPRWQSVLLLGALAPILVALLLSYSRGSLIGFLAGCAVIATLRDRRLWLVGAVLLAAVLLSPSLRESTFVTHLQSGLEVRDQAAAMRLGEYKDAMRLISEYPVFGVGFGEAPDVDLYIGVSSIYLLLAEQVGIVGLSIWLWTIGLVLLRAVRHVLEVDDESTHLTATCLAALVAMLVAGAFDHHFVDMNFPHVVAMVWLIVGLLMVTLDRRVRTAANGA
jgi:O-antigen ligase